MKWFEWSFDGFGTALSSAILKLVTRNKNNKLGENVTSITQTQKARDFARQEQKLVFNKCDAAKTETANAPSQEQYSSNKAEPLQGNGISILSNIPTQKAGDGAQQIQAIGGVINIGVSEERVRAIFAELIPVALKKYTKETGENKQIIMQEFEKRLMLKLPQSDNSLQAFSTPSFQPLLTDALQSAAKTDREEYYDILTDLLACLIKNQEDRKMQVGIHQAIRIVGEIEYNSLCALTAVHAFEKFCPEPGMCFAGLNRINQTFSKIMDQELPSGIDWLEHLETLGAVRLYPQSMEMQGVIEHYSSTMNGYLCVGIKKDSEDYEKAIFMLDAAGIGHKCLIPNECLDGYVRLPIANENAIDKLYFDRGTEHVYLNCEQKQILRQIWKMYSQDPSLQQQVKNKFANILDFFDALRRYRFWWDSIPQPFNNTLVGRILAHANARRCDPELPDFQW